MKIAWRSPSNIALIKYWGKHGNQLPNNTSLSLTLHEAFTETSLELKKKRSKKNIEIDFLFEGNKNVAFGNKIINYFDVVKNDFTFLTTNRVVIRSENSFPHSAGIASSASSMSALALCLMSQWAITFQKQISYDEFLKKASFYSRLGSGSASRSVLPEFAIWGFTKQVKNSSDEYAIQFPKNYHKDFIELQDTILIVAKEEKSVSSRAGHALMENHTMEKQRYINAAQRLKLLLSALKSGDLETFCEMVEAEAMELHALMMTSSPSFMLIKPNTVEIINRIKRFRAESNIPVCFTLDAGPNVHVLYPYFEKKNVRNFIQSELLQFCVNKKVIYDHMGSGPKQLIDD
ncbi:MAG: diphosphomevalonate/mevalonate 3,5-bisphosphate decarboxylase family protein [Chitinophagales bacterium]